MKRNMDLIRLQLMELEAGEDMPELSNYTEDEKVYNAALLIESGLVDGNIVEGGDGQPVGTVMRRLTWTGHDFLDAIREQGIWNKVKQRASKVGSWTFDILLECAKQEIKSQLLGGGAAS